MNLCICFHIIKKNNNGKKASFSKKKRDFYNLRITNAGKWLYECGIESNVKIYRKRGNIYIFLVRNGEMMIKSLLMQLNYILKIYILIWVSYFSEIEMSENIIRDEYMYQSVFT